MSSNNNSLRRGYTATLAAAAAARMPRGVKKENLPTKTCVTCGRPFTWRKKWERCWDEVTTCSKSCNNKRRQKSKGSSPQNATTKTTATTTTTTMEGGAHERVQRRSMSTQLLGEESDDDDEDEGRILQTVMAAAKNNSDQYFIKENPSLSESDNDGTDSSCHSHRLIEGNHDMAFSTPCPECSTQIETRVLPANIPHFDSMILYSTTCDTCGYKSNEFKQGGGAIPETGRRLTLKVTSIEDLSRDVIKSSSSGIAIPEIELELEASAGGGGEGAYTTVEGLLRTMHTTLQQANPFSPTVGTDDAVRKPHERYLQVLRSLQDMADGTTLPFTLIVTDHMANSFIGPSHLENDCSNDDRLSIVEFERSSEENEMLGITGLPVDPGREDTSDPMVVDAEDSRTAERKARKEAKKAKKAERRAQRQGEGDPDAGRKACDLCSKRVNLLIRCMHEEGQTDWSMVCGKCWNIVSGGVPDGDANHPHYRYGGLWKNRRAQQG